MTDAINPLAAIQPDEGGTPPAPEPPTPPAPEPPAAPEPPTPPAGDDGKLTEAEQKDLDEWGAAVEDVFPGLRKSPEEGKDGKTDAEKSGKEAGKDGEADPNKEPNAGQENGAKPQPPKSDAAKDGSDEAGAQDDDTENEPPEPTDAASRISEREQQAAIAQFKNEITTKLYGENGIPTQLTAGDGEPLDTVEKVMEYNKPGTNEPFTREEATAWLAQAQDKFKADVAAAQKEVDAVYDTQMSLKDQTDIIAYQYGELLNAMPELKDQLWAEYSKSVTMKNGLITRAPMSLQKFYETALEPYAQLGRQLEQQDGDKAAADKAAADKAAADKKAAEEKRAQTRSDRSDIYGGGKTDTRDDDQKEWDAAAEAVFGDQLKGLRR